MKYVFKNKFLSVLFFVFDALGSIAFLPLRFSRVPSDPKKILVVRLDHIGDFIATTPLMRLLKEKFPHVSISVAVNPALVELARSFPYIDEVISFDAPWFKRPKVKVTWHDVRVLAAKFKEGNFDIGIDPRGDFFSICALAFARVPFRCGYGITGGGFLLHREEYFNRRAGVIARNLSTSPFLSIGDKIPKILPEVFYSESDKRKVDNVLAGFSIADKKMIALHPFAGTSAKQWPQASFQKLIDALLSQDRTIFLVGTKKDTHNLQNVIDLRGEFNLNELAYLIKRLGFFIGLDSGPAHLAIATKTPSVILCSGTNIPELWLPQASFVKLAKHNIKCKPCGMSECPKKIHYCMEAISVEEVVMGVNELKG